MKISVVHFHRFTRQVLATVLAGKLNAEVVPFANLEELFDSSMDYDIFVVYALFGRGKMDGYEGVKLIKKYKPNALVIYMIQQRFFERHGSPPAGLAATFLASDDTEEVVNFIRAHWKPAPSSDHLGNSEKP